MTATITPLKPTFSILDSYSDVTAEAARKGTQIMDDLKLDEAIAAFLLYNIRHAYLRNEKSFKIGTGTIRRTVTANLYSYFYPRELRDQAEQAITRFDAEGFRLYLAHSIARHITAKPHNFKAEFTEECHKGQTHHFLTITW